MTTLVKYLLIVIGFSLIYIFVAKIRGDAIEREYESTNNRETKSLSKTYIKEIPTTILKYTNK